MSKKNTDYQIEIDLSTDAVKKAIRWLLKLVVAIVVPPLSLLEKAGVHKRPVLVGLGLGLGFVFSILTTQRPDILQAFPAAAQNVGIVVQPQVLWVSRIDWHADISSQSVNEALLGRVVESLLLDPRSAGLGTQGNIVVFDNPIGGAEKHLAQLKIGDEVVVRASNTAEYRYSITEIRQIQAEYLPHIFNMHSDALYLYAARNPLRTQLLVLVAKPI